MVSLSLWLRECFFDFLLSLTASESWNKQSIYFACLSVCLSICQSVCLFVSNKRQNGWTDRDQISVTPGKVYGWSNFQKFAYKIFLIIHEMFVSVNPGKVYGWSNFWKFWKSTFLIKSSKFSFAFVLQCIQLNKKIDLLKA